MCGIVTLKVSTLIFATKSGSPWILSSSIPTPTTILLFFPFSNIIRWLNNVCKIVTLGQSVYKARKYATSCKTNSCRSGWKSISAFDVRNNMCNKNYSKILLYQKHLHTSSLVFIILASLVNEKTLREIVQMEWKKFSLPDWTTVISLRCNCAAVKETCILLFKASRVLWHEQYDLSCADWPSRNCTIAIVSLRPPCSCHV